MSVKVRTYRRGGWEVDITVLLPDGTRFRERKKATVSSQTRARQWGEARERELLRSGPPCARKEVPTLRDFAPRFLDGYARANRQKPSGIAGKETILRVHLVPALGGRRLDAITTEDVQRLKRALENRSPKTVNNVLTVLNTLLKQAVAWDVIETVPCTIRLLKAPQAAVRFHDFEAFERLVVAADRLDRTTLLLVAVGDPPALPGRPAAFDVSGSQARKLLLVSRSSITRRSPHDDVPKSQSYEMALSVSRGVHSEVSPEGDVRRPAAGVGRSISAVGGASGE